MSNYYGDFLVSKTVRLRFNTVSSSGAPTTLTTGAVIVSKDGADVTPSGGVTLTTDAGAVTGRHFVVIDMSIDTTTFTAGSEYAVRLSGSSAVGGTSVVGIVVGEWSVENRSVAVDASGKVTVGTNSDKTGYSLAVTPPTSAAIATAVAASILATPAQLLVTDASGRVSLNPSQALGTPRDVSAVADGSLTINDALWSAIGAGAGRKDLVGTTVTLATPLTHTTLRTFTIDSATAPTYLH